MTEKNVLTEEQKGFIRRTTEKWWCMDIMHEMYPELPDKKKNQILMNFKMNQLLIRLVPIIYGIFKEKYIDYPDLKIDCDGEYYGIHHALIFNEIHKYYKEMWDYVREKDTK